MRDSELADLLGRAADGDEDAAGELVRHYERPVRKTIHFRLGPELRARVDTDDIFQSTIATAIHDLPNVSFRGEKAFVGWLRTIAERRVQMAVRHHRAQKRDVRKDLPLDAAERVAGKLTSPTKGAVRAELTIGVQQAIARLPEEERRVVELHSYEGLSFQEVAERLGLRNKNQAYRIFENALNRMGDLIESEHGEASPRE